MTAEQIERNRAFLADLRANPKKTIHRMRDGSGGRCCLCVAYDTAQRLGAELPEITCQLPPEEMADFYGWPVELDDSDPRLKHGGTIAYASTFNDGDGGNELTHAQIADAFEETFPELRTPAPATGDE